MLKNKRSLRSYLSLAIAMLVLVVMCFAFAVIGSANDEATPAAEKTEINVWLIAGQSNAVGFAEDVTDEQAQDNRFFEGFDNVLYYGYSEGWVSDIEKVTLFQGQALKKSGAEIGIAEALGDSGTMNVVIKHSSGATNIYPVTSGTYANRGTWTSPTYIADNNISTSGNKIGKLYTDFLNTISTTCTKLDAMGYKPVVRGMWWMQGEAETGDATQANAYEELLTDLINDIRRDVGNITGEDLSKMPFVFGKIYQNPKFTGGPYIPTVNADQAAVAAKAGFNAFLVDPTDCPDLAQHDRWHFTAATQQFFGEQFVEKALAALGLSKVDVKGTNVTLTGGGFHKAGDSVTVKLTAPEGYTITGVTMSVGGADAEAINLNTDGTYTFNSEGKDVVFTATTSGAAQATAYGTVPAEFDKDNYPFALFKNGSFFDGYVSWRTAMLALPTGATSDEYTLLLRRNYTTARVDGAGASRITNVGSKLTLDLGGNNITRSGAYIFDIFHNNKNTFTTDVTVKGGTLTSISDSPLIGLNYSVDSENANKRTYNFTFEGVNIVNAATSRTVPVITACWENGNSNVYAGIHANVALNGCTVDFGSVTNGIVAGFTNDAKVTNTVGTLTVNGGNIISKGGSYSLAKMDSKDTVVIGSYKGSYPTVTLPSGVSPSTELYKDADGLNCEASGGVTSGSNTVYTIAPNTLITPHGTITDSTFADVEAYPFAIFNPNGFVTCVATFKDAIDKGFNNMKNGEVTIYLRRDYDNTSDDNNTGSFLTYINGTMKIDLGGNTLAAKGRTLFNWFIDGKSTSGYVSNVEVFGGTLAAKSDNVIVAMEYNGGSSQSATAVKKFNMSFTDVEFKSEYAITNNYALVLYVYDKTVNVAYQSEATFDFYACTFDMTNVNSDKRVFWVEDRTNRTSSIDCTVNVHGGEFLNMGTNKFAEMDAGDNICIGTYAGKYPTATTAAGTDIKDAGANFDAIGTTNTENVLSPYKTASDSNWNYYVFMLQEVTAYGNIALDANQSKTDYPLAVFEDNGDGTYTFISLYTGAKWIDAVNAAASKAKSVIYFRADVTPDNSNVYANDKTTSITVDLNGHTLIKGNAAYLIMSVASAAKTNVNISFKNGNIVNNYTASTSNWRGFFQINYNSDHTVQDATVNYTFNNVKFKDNRTAVGHFIFSLAQNGGSGKKSVNSTVIFNDCELYPTNAEGGVVQHIFNGADSESNKTIDITYIVNGGRIISSADIEISKLININDGDSVVFGQGANGYTEFVYTVSMGNPSGSISVKDADGNTRVLVYKSTDGTYNYYELAIPSATSGGTESTVYGDYTYTQAQTPAAYPLVVFKSDKTVVGLYENWQAAFNAAVAYNNSVIYFRANVARHTSEKGASLAGKQVSITVDLNGMTLTKTEHYLFDNTVDGNSTNSTVTFKNGYMAQAETATWRGFIHYNYNANHKNSDAYINFTFDKVTFKDNRTTSNTNFIITVNEDARATSGIKQTYGTLNFNNCEIRLTGNTAYIFNAYHSLANNVILTYNVNGGRIVSGAAITLDMLVKVNDTGDSVNFGAGENGYIEFVYPSNVTPSESIVITDADGAKRILKLKGTEGTNNVYELAVVEVTEYTESTAYGDFTYTSLETPDKYPLVVFTKNADGTYTKLGLYNNWRVAVETALVNDGSVVYLRTDFTTGSTDDQKGARPEGKTASITVDLNNKIFTKTEHYMFDAYVNGGTTKVNVLVKNGTMVQAKGNRAFVYYNAGGGHTGTSNAVINYTFENIIFKDERGTTGQYYDYVIASNNIAESLNKISGKVTFKNCDFYVTHTRIANAGETNSRIDLECVIEGGKIVSSMNLTSSIIFAKNNSGDSLTFGRYNGKYITVELTNGATMDGGVWNTAEGIDCSFVKNGAGYALYPTVMVGYKIKTSVTLWSNFIYNIYIPEANFNKVMINGYDVDAALVEIDEENYYHVAVNLEAGLALSDIKLKITLNSGSTTVDANWTLNVLKYTNAVIDGSYSDVAKTLMKDMLVYAKAAHDYFGNALDSTKEDTVEALLEGYNKEMPTGEAKKPSDTSDTEYFKEVTVNLDKVPSFRFYLAGTYTADCFTAKVGDKDVELVTNSDDKGNYIEITMYAYMMLDDVKFTEKGTDVTVSYNLYAYYEFATDPNNTDSTAELVAIVEGLMKYSASAKAYRTAYIAANPNA